MATGHYLRHNASEWSPARVVVIDTESRQAPTDAGRLHTLRVACGAFIHRRRSRTTGGPWTGAVTTTDPAELWAWVDGHTSGAESTWCYAHNLAFDLCVSQAMIELPRLGWEVTDFSSLPRCTYVRWFRHSRTCDGTCRDPARLKAGGRACHGRRLVMADSASLLPASIDRIGKLLGLSSEVGPGDPELAPGQAARARDLLKLPMPADDDGLERWSDYCRRDTEILAEAVLTILDWWDREGLGHWSITGPGCGWAALRHRHLEAPVLVHHDPGATSLERAAYFGGRREVFRVGEAQGGPFPYLDFEAHYAHVAAREAVPTQLLFTLAEVDPARLVGLPDHLGVIARVQVSTTEPLVPVRGPDGVTYPVGEFTTTVAGPELALLAEHEAVARVIAAAVYRMAPALGTWASWVLDLLRDRTDPRARLVGLLAKGWSHSVLGKFGQVGRTKRRAWETMPDDHGTTPIIDADSDRRGSLTYLGGWAWITWAGGEPDNAVPAIAAWITSAARVELWRLMEAAGKERVLWCDTDGIILEGPPAPSPKEQPPAHSNGTARVATSSETPASTTTTQHASISGAPAAGPAQGPTQRGSSSGGDGTTPILDPDWWLWPGWDRLVATPLVVKAVYSSVRFDLPGAYRVDGHDVIKGLPAGRQEVSPGAFRYELWTSLGVQLAAHAGRAFETWTRTASVHAAYRAGTVGPEGRVRPLVLGLVDGANRAVRSSPGNGRGSVPPNAGRPRGDSPAERDRAVGRSGGRKARPGYRTPSGAAGPARAGRSRADPGT